MTWSAFNTLVRLHLGPENRRQGIQSWIDALILAAVLDLQSSIPAYRVGHVHTYAPGEFTADGLAAKAGYQVDGVITEAFVRDPGTETDDFGVVETPGSTWRTFDYQTVRDDQDLRRMRDGLTGRGERLIYIYPTDGVFWVVPSPINDQASVTVTWDGVKNSFNNSDSVPFDERAAEAVSDYVMSRIARRVDKDLAGAQTYNQSYQGIKRRIYSDKMEVANMPGRSKKAGTFTNDYVVPLVPAAPAVDAAIHSWSDLAGIATTGLALGSLHSWLDTASGTIITVQLLAGINPTNLATGTQQPTDFNAVTNAKVWYVV